MDSLCTLGMGLLGPPTIPAPGVSACRSPVLCDPREGLLANPKATEGFLEEAMSQLSPEGSAIATQAEKKGRVTQAEGTAGAGSRCH